MRNCACTLRTYELRRFLRTVMLCLSKASQSTECLQHYYFSSENHFQSHLHALSVLLSETKPVPARWVLSLKGLLRGPVISVKLSGLGIILRFVGLYYT